MGRVYYYEDDPLKTHESLARYEFARPYVTGAVVLDIGCGARKGPLVLAQNAKEVVGSDISKEAVFHCNKKWHLPNLRYLASDAVVLPFVDSVFDVEVAFEVLEHVSQQQQFLQEAKRALKKDGVFILSTPNKSVMSPEGVFQNPDHVREFSAQELKELLLSVFGQVELYGQKPSARVLDVLGRRKQSYQSVSRIPVFLRHIFPGFVRRRLFDAYVGAKENINEVDFPIVKDTIEEAHYLVAVCR